MIRSSKPILFILILIMACSSPEKADENPDTDMIGGQLFLDSEHTTGRLGRSYSIMGNINPEPGIWGNIDAGIMTISNVDLIFDPAHDGYGFGCLYNYDSLNGQVPVFGGVGRWGITGDESKGIYGFCTEMYSPEIIHILSPPTDIKVNKNDTIKIVWEPDPNYMGDVLLFVTGFGNYPNLSREIPDNGEYYLPMDSINIKSFSIELLRRNEKWIKVGERWYQLVAATSETKHYTN